MSEKDRGILGARLEEREFNQRRERSTIHFWEEGKRRERMGWNHWIREIGPHMSAFMSE